MSVTCESERNGSSGPYPLKSADSCEAIAATFCSSTTAPFDCAAARTESAPTTTPRVNNVRRMSDSISRFTPPARLGAPAPRHRLGATVLRGERARQALQLWLDAGLR